MRLLILTTCTGAKAASHDQALTLQDFQKGGRHVARRERALAELLRPAEEMYTGQQHLRLMRGVQALRTAAPVNGSPTNGVELFILSAGYGFIPGDRRIAPYECTFTGMGAQALKGWAETLETPANLRKLLGEKYDLALVLLSDNYLKACALAADFEPSGPVLFLCSAEAAKKLPAIPGVRPIGLSKDAARRFACGLVGLKGEVAGRILERIARDGTMVRRLADPSVDVLALLDNPASKRRSGRTARVNPEVDRVITIPETWWRQSRKGKLSYFIPEWDDLVDPDYDFVTDQHSHGRGHWSNNVYAHQLYPEPNYDGILISKLVADANEKKEARLSALGVHRFLRVPDAFPVMGDCGAFGYINEEVPPYSTSEILDYYTRLGFDYGVSIDHLIVASTEGQRQKRYELTIHNAADFLKEHRRRGLSWEPIGTVQGWDPQSYTKATKKYVKMGYRYIALGGLVRDQTREILRIVEAVKEVLPEGLRLHLFGLARLDAMRDFVRLGVTSIDSASVLRRGSVSGSTSNFLTPSGWYPAIRVPQVEDCFRARRLVDAGERTADQLRQLEQECLGALRDFGARRQPLSANVLDRLTEYDTLLAGDRKGTREGIRRTLEDRPWEACGCAICARWGVEVAIFRGNNRNRRRGFHNTCVFYRLLGRILEGERIAWINPDRPTQLGLFDP